MKDRSIIDEDPRLVRKVMLDHGIFVIGSKQASEWARRGGPKTVQKVQGWIENYKQGLEGEAL